MVDYDDDVPAPNVAARREWNFGEMGTVKNRSFAVPVSEANLLRSAASKYKRRNPGWDYVTRFEDGSLRLWCIAVPIAGEPAAEVDSYDPAIHGPLSVWRPT